MKMNNVNKKIILFRDKTTKMLVTGKL